MKKSNIIRVMLFATITTMLCSCSSDEIFTDTISGTQKMSLKVLDEGFTNENGAKTRTTDSGITTIFTDSDSIGIYITDGTAVKYANLKYTFDGTNWSNSIYGTSMPYLANGKYFAYYPYKSSFTAADVAGDKTSAEDFFAAIISGWTPATDQSTQANYTAQDLMVALGTSGDGYQFTFPMAHQMALLEADFAQVTYWTNTGVSTGVSGDKYRFEDNSYKLYNISDGAYRMIVKPEQSVTLKGSIYSDPTTKIKNWNITGTSPSKSYLQVYKLNGEEPSFLNYVPTVGSLYNEDGTCSNKVISNKKPIGIIVSTNSLYCESANGYGHGLVISLMGVGSLVNWGPNNDEALGNKEKLKDCYEDVSGLSNTSAIATAHTLSSTPTDGYPAFYYAYIDYNDSRPAPLECSGWFLPSIGQWWNTLEEVTAKYGKTLDLIKYHDSSDMGYNSNDNSNDDGKIIHDSFSSLIDKYKGLYIEDISDTYWSSSEGDVGLMVWRIDLPTDAEIRLRIEFDVKVCPYRVRPFLAF